MSRPNRSQSKLFTGEGLPITLGSRLASGGEGTVYRIEGEAGRVVKIYHETPSEQKIAKLRAMIAHESSDLDSLTTWPQATVHETAGGPCVGFAMVSAEGFKEAHKLYSPRDRKAEFDHADWRFLVRASSNIAKAFAATHATGSVVGDVNHSSVMVGKDATVRLIDCDSFQLSYGDGFYPCEVGEPLHTAPELFGQSLRELRRTPNHDAFGLAVLVFELLFMGKHPFAGAYLGAGDPSLEDKIKEFRFAYAPNAEELQVAPPAASLSLDYLPPEMAEMFILAFSAQGAEGSPRSGLDDVQPRGGAPGSFGKLRAGSHPAATGEALSKPHWGRPTAIEWAEQLDLLFEELATCAVDEAHAYYSGAPECPWCPIERETGATLFNPGVAFRPSGSVGFDPEAAWRAIEAVKPPEPLRIDGTPSQPTAPSAAVRAARAKRRFAWSGSAALVTAAALATIARFPGNANAWGLIILAAAAALTVFYRQKKAAVLGAEFSLISADGRLHVLEAQWRAEADSALFDALFSELKARKLELQALPRVRAQRLSELERTLEPRVRQRNLERHRIAQHSIEGVNLSRCVTLSSYGVESAADISESSLRAVPTIGDTLKKRLVAWRRDIERGFQFDPDAGIPPEDLDDLNRELAERRRILEADLASGANALSFLKSQIQTARLSLSDPLQRAIQAQAQAAADAKAVSGW